MLYSIDAIIEQLNKLVECYLTRDDKGNPIEEQGYLHRTYMWPEVHATGARWGMVFDLPPLFTSSGQLILDYYIQQSDGNKHKIPGFYVDSNRAGDTLEEALAVLKQSLEKIPQRKNQCLEQSS